MTDGCNQNLGYMDGGTGSSRSQSQSADFVRHSVTPQNGEERPRSAQL